MGLASAWLAPIRPIVKGDGVPFGQLFLEPSVFVYRSKVPFLQLDVSLSRLPQLPERVVHLALNLVALRGTCETKRVL